MSDSDILRKLTSILRLMDSDFASERENAVHQAKIFLDNNNLSWRDFHLVQSKKSNPVTAGAPPAPKASRWSFGRKKQNASINKVITCQAKVVREIPINSGISVVYADIRDSEGVLYANVKTTDTEAVMRIKHSDQSSEDVQLEISGKEGQYFCMS